jgi:16S rRNA (cytosine967-C5)-methyltransferase
MTPGARIATAIEILEKIEFARTPTEDMLSTYLRGRRYIGAKDRKYITQLVFGVQRKKARLDWITGIEKPRIRVITYLFLLNESPKDELISLFNGTVYSPSKLTTEELELIDKITDKPFQNMDYPPQIAAELPIWITEILIEYWGMQFQNETRALNETASLNLRVNTHKGNCQKTLKILKKDNIKSSATKFSPLGLKIDGRTNLTASTAFKGGFIEIQDEGSQLVAALVETKANMKTIDLCAGSGGKTLAIGAAMRDGGPLVACDVNLKRLKKLKPRLKRAGLTNVTIHHLSGPDDSFYKDHKLTAERVLIDVPCSGSGTWRRTPFQKWKLTRSKLQEIIVLQREILDQSANLVINGGRLIYATCSVLPDENERQITWFLAKNPSFKALSISDIWERVLDMECPSSALIDNAYLSLTPARHDTDGFFTAVLEKTNN